MDHEALAKLAAQQRANGTEKKGMVFQSNEKVEHTLHTSTYTLHPVPSTIHPTPHTLHPTPYTLHPAPCNPHPTPHTLTKHLKPQSAESHL